MKLIDADALLEKFNRKADIWTALTDEDTAGDFAFYCKLADAVEDMPTVDAVPVKHVITALMDLRDAFVAKQPRSEWYKDKTAQGVEKGIEMCIVRIREIAKDD